MEAHARRLEALRRSGIVERIDADRWRIPHDFETRAAAYDTKRNRQVAVRVLSTFDLEARFDQMARPGLIGSSLGETPLR